MNHLDEICSMVDGQLEGNPELAFAVVVWIKGKADAKSCVAVGGPPETQGEAVSALKTAAECLRATFS